VSLTVEVSARYPGPSPASRMANRRRGNSSFEVITKKCLSGFAAETPLVSVVLLIATPRKPSFRGGVAGHHALICPKSRYALIL
jgi:hypothetical protein